MQLQNSAVYTKIGNWWYLPELKILVKLDNAGQIISTTTLDLFCQKTISFFISHPGRFISRQELIHQVWGKVEVSEQQLNAVINRLRHNFFDEGNAEVYLQTISKAGYRFIDLYQQQWTLH